MPAGYSIMDLTAGPPSKDDTALNGNVAGAGCTAFRVTLASRPGQSR